MDLNLNSEQQQLQDSVRRFIDKAYSFEARQALLQRGQGGSAEHWRLFADNGWLAAALPEAYGGLGGSIIETALIAQQFGRGLVLEPYVGCAVLAAQTLAAGGTPAQKDRWLPALADGSRRIALAYSEPASRGLPQPAGLRAERSGSGYRLNGSKSLVLGGPYADAFIVSAQVASDEGLTLFLVEGDAPGLARQTLPLHDGTLCQEVVLTDVNCEACAVLGAAGAGLPALQQGLAQGMAALCAQLIGAMEQAIEVTAEYLKTRQQFGVPIGSFQALQHRIADMSARLELARSMLFAALAAITNEEGAAQQQTLAAAKTLIGRAAKYVCGQAIQLHGGIGMTEECRVGHYFRHAIVADLSLGSSDRHEAAYAAGLQHDAARV